MSDFGREEFDRYSRQTNFVGLGRSEQELLAKSRVLILGCGGLGSASASLLARAGVGYLRLADRDFMELSNLQRQILYDEHDVKEGLPKVIAAQRKLREINANTRVEPVIADVNRTNIESLIEGVHLVIDGSDNFETRYLLNEACVKHNVPWIYGAAVESYGMCMNIIPRKTACLHCVMEHVPRPNATPASETEGVLGPIVTMIASIQSAEAMKILTHKMDALNKAIIVIDLWQNSYQAIDIAALRETVNCPVCSQSKFEYLSGRFGNLYTRVVGQNAVQIIPFETQKLDLPRLAIELASQGSVKVNEYVVRIEIDRCELSIFQDGRTVVSGTADTGIARNYYTKYVKQCVDSHQQ
ncbi:MAG: ThiF family adenylyltransferase [Candidatus Zhuqueibacterota bacterium]